MLKYSKARGRVQDSVVRAHSHVYDAYISIWPDLASASSEEVTTEVIRLLHGGDSALDNNEDDRAEREAQASAEQAAHALLSADRDMVMNLVAFWNSVNVSVPAKYRPLLHKFIQEATEKHMDSDSVDVDLKDALRFCHNFMSKHISPAWIGQPHPDPPSSEREPHQCRGHLLGYFQLTEGDH